MYMYVCICIKHTWKFEYVSEDHDMLVWDVTNLKTGWFDAPIPHLKTNRFLEGVYADKKQKNLKEICQTPNSQKDNTNNSPILMTGGEKL
jgi:hypothetical protein